MSSPTVADNRYGEAETIRIALVRINWEIKALVPIAFVLLAELLLFLLATLSLA